MKISRTGPPAAGEITTEKQKKTESPGEGKFGEFLKKAVDGAGRTKGDAPASPVKEINYPQISGVQPAGIANRMEAIGRAERLLDILGDYSSKIDDPRYTLKEMHELVVGMETEKASLLPLMESLPEGDGARDLLNRILVTASVEAIKFNRGDYLP
ncbi:MAG: hypothetical protein NTV99_00155 [Deltaproteobacteria bacterium]|nr:hypothetical protein [Deltaproteobacteria bacterium]